MKIESGVFEVDDWSTVGLTEHPGTTGMATWRTVEQGNLRVRMVEYSPGYLADHWCERGHVVLVVSGELETELRDGRRVLTRAGQSYRVSEGVAPHRSSTRTGARLFIVD